MEHVVDEFEAELAAARLATKQADWWFMDCPSEPIRTVDRPRIALDYWTGCKVKAAMMAMGCHGEGR
jgi:hypothetical protein